MGEKTTDPLRQPSSITAARDARRLAPSFAGVCLMAAMLFVTVFSVPTLGVLTVAMLGLVWLACLSVTLVFFLRRPWVALAAPLLDFALWCAVVALR